ncbi:MAG: ABC transporter ATP-binding protein [Halanaerobiales bacterium]|nr:ABC transporter ATP-binding protein [Halanaerobiales bacterium]
MLKLEDINFSYEKQKILHKINFHLEENEFIGIIGPNGSGKSTLLKNISKLLSPDSGYIYLDKGLLNEYSYKELARKMAVVPQDTEVNFNFSVYDLVMMGRNPYQDRWGRVSEKDKKKVEEALTLTDTKKFQDKSIQKLSGGERQRVIIARAIVQEPELLLLDEPTASLDINYQRNIFDLISDLNDELEMSVLAVSHDLNLISQYCERLILLSKGNIHTIGRVEEVITKENISEVYNTEVDIKYNPMTERPYVIIVPRKKNSYKRRENNFKVHLICGGGTGKDIMNILNDLNIKVSCGVLNRGDSDWEEAKRLNYEIVEIPPFAPIDKNAVEKNKKKIGNSDLIIVSNTPFGWGNLDNIKVLTNFEEKDILFMTNQDVEARDFTEGKTTELFEKIKKNNNVREINNNKELCSFINTNYKEILYD